MFLGLSSTTKCGQPSKDDLYHSKQDGSDCYTRADRVNLMIHSAVNFDENNHTGHVCRKIIFHI